MKKNAVWAVVAVVVIAALALLLIPGAANRDAAVTVTATPEVTAAPTAVAVETEASAAAADPTAQPADQSAAAVSADVETPAASNLGEGVLATINGRPVLEEDVYLIAENLMYTYSQYGYDFSDPTMQQQLYSMAMEYCLQLSLMEQKAAEWGFDKMNDEEAALMETEVAAEWENMIDTYIQYYVGLAEDATEDDKAAARVTAIAGLEAMGYTIDTLKQDYQDNLMFEKVEAEVVKGAVVTDDEVKAAFDAYVASDEAAYAQDIMSYEYMTQYYGQNSYYTPAGYRGVTHILLEVDETLLNTYHELAARLEEQEAAAEEAAASPTDVATSTDVASATDLVTQADVDAAYNAVMASVQPTIDEINQKLADGVSFEELIAEYGTDPGMTMEPNKSEGYPVHMDSIVWDPVFVRAAFSVDNVGEIADPVLGSYGVHIVKYHRDVPAGPVEMTDETAAAIREELLVEKESELFNNAMNEWFESAEIIYAAVEADDASTEAE
ncbi:MAG: peptidylprolyl isomerase [Clostridia bacterium]|nr:peptidylprolyl isomerase [Clostridia bacterium]